jgi:phosphatidylserine decarboxylase
MKDRLFILLQYIVPQHLISRLVGFLAECRLPLIKDPLIKLFAKQFKVNMQEAQREDLADYVNFNDFFTRSLKDDARHIDVNDEHLACPVDGAISQIGDIKAGKVFQAKGQDYDVTTLLGGDSDLAEPFIDGQFTTIYLAPKDYHRIHMPCDGKLTSMVHVPGQLFSVNQATAENVPGLFARNERVVAMFDTEFGPMAMVLVGAMIVASVETPWAGLVCPTGKQVTSWQYSDQGDIIIRKGEEMGRFKLGSTVVMCLPKGTCQWNEELQPGVTTRMGQMLAKLKDD